MCTFYKGMLMFLPNSDGVCVSSPWTWVDFYNFLHYQIVGEVTSTDSRLSHRSKVVCTCFFLSFPLRSRVLKAQSHDEATMLSNLEVGHIEWTERDAAVTGPSQGARPVSEVLRDDSTPSKVWLRWWIDPKYILPGGAPAIPQNMQGNNDRLLLWF